MRQIVTLHLGQAGVQIGSSFWQLICSEHNINFDGNRIVSDVKKQNIDLGKAQVLFSQTIKGKFVPRSFFFDSDPITIDQVKTKQMKKLFHPDKFHTQNEGSCSFFTRGRYLFGLQRQNIQNKIRKLIESCHNIQAIIIFLSVSGGTGSGFSSGLLTILKFNFPKIPVITLIVNPSRRYSNVIVQHYNTVLAYNQLIKQSDANIVFTNQKMYNLCSENLDIQNPNFTNLNRMISRVASSITAPQRFQRSSDTNINHLLTNLIPYPKVNLLTATYGPLINQNCQYQNILLEKQLTRFCFNRKNNMFNANPPENKDRQLCCAAFYRGQINKFQILDEIQQIKRSSGNSMMKLVDWSPTGVKINYTNQASMPFRYDFMAQQKIDCCLLMNTSFIRSEFENIYDKYMKLWRPRAFVHWFMSYCNSDQFQEARYDYETLLKDYQQVVL